MKHKLLLAILITNFILVSFNSSVINQTSKNTTSSSSSYSHNSGSGKTTTVSTSEDGVTVKVISVDPKCVGCGKCARIDSTHFQMNRNTHKAEAIQATGNENALNHAINDCPVGAINVS